MPWERAAFPVFFVTMFVEDGLPEAVVPVLVLFEPSVVVLAALVVLVALVPVVCRFVGALAEPLVPEIVCPFTMTTPPEALSPVGRFVGLLGEPLVPEIVCPFTMTTPPEALSPVGKFVGVLGEPFAPEIVCPFTTTIPPVAPVSVASLLLRLAVRDEILLDSEASRLLRLALKEGPNPGISVDWVAPEVIKAERRTTSECMGCILAQLFFFFF